MIDLDQEIDTFCAPMMFVWIGEDCHTVRGIRGNRVKIGRPVGGGWKNPPKRSYISLTVFDKQYKAYIQYQKEPNRVIRITHISARVTKLETESAIFHMDLMRAWNQLNLEHPDA